MNIRNKKMLVLPILLWSMLGLACSAEEANASTSANANSVSKVDAVVSQPVSEPDVVDEHAGHAHASTPVSGADSSAVSSDGIHPRYAAMFDEAKGLINSALQNNPNNFVAGEHYDVVSDVKPKSSQPIEVAEFFSYGCGHCASYEPFIHAYAEQLPEDAKFVRVPVSFNPYFEALARGYYAAKAQGIEETAHVALFDAIHNKKTNFQNKEALAEFYAAYGVDKEKFLADMYSFSINSQIVKDKKLTSAYQITGVPSVIVNGTYNTGGSKAGSTETWFQILDSLVEKERNK